MAGLTRYGTIWGSIPATSGQIFWVAPGAGAYTVGGTTYDASDGNDGKDPRRAKATIDNAIGSCTADSGDVIVCLPGTHALTASIALDVAGVTITGLPGGAGNFLKQKTTIDGTALTTDQCINVTVANCEIAYLNFIPLTGDTAIDLTAAADQLHIHDCSFDFATPAVSTGTVGIEALGAASNLLVSRCSWECDGAQGDAIVATATVDSVITDCLFSLSAGSWASTILCGAAVDRLLITNSQWHCAGTAITAAVNGTGATLANGVAVTKCIFADVGTNVPIDGFSAAECNISENYNTGVGSTDGGVLVVAIT